MLKHCVLTLPVWMLLIGSAFAADRYFYCNGEKAYYCNQPAQYSEGCYVVRNQPGSVVKVNGYPVISSIRATTMIKTCSGSVVNVVSSPTVAGPCCGCPPSGDCRCKNLSCKLKLWPPHCKKYGKPIKTPIKCEIYGEIPKDEVCIHCYEMYREFSCVTSVPTILCQTEECVEIGTKKLECKVDNYKPGCWFKVCVPINKCTTQTVECKLVDKSMPHKVYKRTEKGKVSYDVYVINDPDPASATHAGGMPNEWLIMHCASKKDLDDKFGGLVANNGKVEATTVSTTADVDIELMFDEEVLKKYLAESTDENSNSTSEHDAATEAPQPEVSGSDVASPASAQVG